MSTRRFNNDERKDQQYEERLRSSTNSAHEGSMGGLGVHFTRLPTIEEQAPKQKTDELYMEPLLDSAKKHFQTLKGWVLTSPLNIPTMKVHTHENKEYDLDDEDLQHITPRGWEILDTLPEKNDTLHDCLRKPISRGSDFDISVFESVTHFDAQLRSRMQIIQSLFENRQVCDNLMSKLREEFKKRNLLNVEERISSELDTLINILKRPRAAMSLIFENQNRIFVNFFINHRNILYKERKLYVACCMTYGERQGGGMNHILQNPHPELTTEDALEILFFLHQYPALRRTAIKILEGRPLGEVEVFLPQLLQTINYFGDDDSISSFLLRLANTSRHIYNQFSWILLAQQQVKPSPYIEKLHKQLENLEGCEPDVNLFNKQRKLVNNFNNISKYLKTYLGKFTREERVKQLKSIINGTHNFPQYISMIDLERGTVQTQQSLQNMVCMMYDWSLIFPLERLPLESLHQLRIKGIKTEECSMFKSAMAPLVIPFIVDEENEKIIRVIFKRGDDLRQDALIMQVIRFMDDILKKKNLNLCLSIYDVMAMGLDHGMVELVPKSHTIASVLESHSTIYDFLAHKHDTYESFERALRTFVKSCAGYCVITFLLGIGDRHLDNILLREDGRLFHIDFGFVLGKDPKPHFTTPHMRITREMVESMRLPESENLSLLGDFKKYCVQAFCALRQYANIILLMLFLMSDCGLAQVNKDAIRNVRNNFALHLDDHELEAFVLNKVGESLKMYFPKVNDTMHKIAQSLRS
jgi:hypothetical protein